MLVVTMLLVMCSVAFAEDDLVIVADDTYKNVYAVFTGDSDRDSVSYYGKYVMMIHDEDILNDFRMEANNNSAVAVVYQVVFTLDLKKHQIIAYYIVDEKLNILHQVKFGYNKNSFRNTVKNSCMEDIGKKIKATVKK